MRSGAGASGQTKSSSVQKGRGDAEIRGSSVLEQDTQAWETTDIGVAGGRVQGAAGPLPPQLLADAVNQGVCSRRRHSRVARVGGEGEPCCQPWAHVLC